MLCLRSPSFKAVEEGVADLMCEGFPAVRVLRTLSDRLVALPVEELDDLSKAQISVKIADANKRLIDGAEETLQLLDVAATCARCLAACKNKRR